MHIDKSPNSNLEQEINFVELVVKIVKHKNLILSVTGAALIISIGYSLLKPTFYSATAQIIPPIGQKAGLFSALAAVIDPWEVPSLLTHESLEENATICTGILRSRSVEDPVIRRLDLTKAYKTKSLEATRKTLKSMVKIQTGKNDIVSITAKDEDPKRAAAIANTYVEELNRKYIQLNLIQVGAENAFLARIMDEIKKELYESEVSLKSLRAGDEASKISPVAVAALDGLGRINKELLNKNPSTKSADGYRKEDENQIKLAEDEAAKLQSQLAVYVQQHITDARYKRAINELGTLLDLFGSLAQQYRLTRLSEANDPSYIRVLDDTVPVRESKLKRSLVVILSTVSAFIIGIFLAFLKEYMENMLEQEKSRWREIKKLARMR